MEASYPAVSPFSPFPRHQGVMVNMGQKDAYVGDEIQWWRVENISGSTIRLTRVKKGTGQGLEDAIAPSSQTPSALSNFELCEFEKEIINFQFDCLQVQERLEALIVRV